MSLQSIDGSSGSVTETRNSISSPKENRPPSSGAVDRDRRGRVAGGDQRARRGLLARGVEHRQHGGEAAALRVGVRRVGLGRDRRAVTEVPLEADRVARIVVEGALAGELHRQRRRAVRAVRAEHRLGRPLALGVLPLVHARVRADDVEPVAVGQQVERAVRAPLHVHRVVALEHEPAGRGVRAAAALEEAVDLEHVVLIVELDLAHRVLRPLADDHRVVVVRRELLRVRVGRVVGVLRRAVRADAARVELGEQPRALGRGARRDRPRRRA